MTSPLLDADNLPKEGFASYTEYSHAVAKARVEAYRAYEITLEAIDAYERAGGDIVEAGKELHLGR